MLYRKHGHTIKSLSRVATFAKTMVAEEHGTCRTCRKMKEIQEGYDLLVRGGNAVARCSSMWADILRGEYYCGNLLWQSGLTLLFSGQTRLEVCAERFIDQLVEQIESDEGLTRQYMEYLRARDIKVQVEERHVPRDVVVRGIRSHADMLRVAGYAPKWLEEFK